MVGIVCQINLRFMVDPTGIFQIFPAQEMLLLDTERRAPSKMKPGRVTGFYIPVFNSFYIHNLAIREKYYPHKQYRFQYDKA